MSPQHLMLAPVWIESCSCSDTRACCVMLHHCCFFNSGSLWFLEGSCHLGYDVLKPPNKKDEGSPRMAVFFLFFLHII